MIDSTHNLKNILQDVELRKELYLKYGKQCPDFKYFYPNGVPDDAKKRCIECINLANDCPTKQEHEKQDYRCIIPEREAKRKAYFEAANPNQKVLL